METLSTVSDVFSAVGCSGAFVVAICIFNRSRKFGRGSGCGSLGFAGPNRSNTDFLSIGLASLHKLADGIVG